MEQHLRGPPELVERGGRPHRFTLPPAPGARGCTGARPAQRRGARWRGRRARGEAAPHRPAAARTHHTAIATSPTSERGDGRDGAENVRDVVEPVDRAVGDLQHEPGWLASHASPAAEKVTSTSAVVKENADRAARAWPSGRAARLAAGRHAWAARAPSGSAARARPPAERPATGPPPARSRAAVRVRRDVEAARPAQLDDLSQERPPFSATSWIARRFGR